MKTVKFFSAAILGLFILIGYSCGGGASSNSPSDIVSDYFEKWDAGDYDGMMQYFDGYEEFTEKEKEDYKKFLGMAAGSMKDAEGIKEVNVLKEEINEDGSKAIVEIELTMNNGDTKKEEAELVKVNDEWRIKTAF